MPRFSMGVGQTRSAALQGALCGCAHEIEFIEHDYCSGCGAKMDGRDEHETG